MDQRYHSGEEIHIGDRVRYAGCLATIMFVIDREEWPIAESEDSRLWWRSEHKSGFLLTQDGGGRVFLPDADEDLTFTSRGEAPKDI
jgi:hypothetical protein